MNTNNGGKRVETDKPPYTAAVAWAIVAVCIAALAAALSPAFL